MAQAERLRRNLAVVLDLSRSGRCVEISLAVQAHRSPPATLLLMLLGNAVFRRQEVTWRRARPADEPTDTCPDQAPRRGIRPPTSDYGPFRVATANAVDLRRCLPQGNDLWLPLPSLRAGSDAGIPRLFPQRVDKLPEQGTRLGQLGQGTNARIVRFADADRARHCYLLGATGTGKSCATPCCWSWTTTSQVPRWSTCPSCSKTANAGAYCSTTAATTTSSRSGRGKPKGPAAAPTSSPASSATSAPYCCFA